MTCRRLAPRTRGRRRAVGRSRLLFLRTFSSAFTAWNARFAACASTHDCGLHTSSSARGAGAQQVGSQEGPPALTLVALVGATDQLVQWIKGNTNRPKWMSPEQFAALPDSILVRELRYAVNQKGFRPKQITLVTTLIDAEVYSKEKLADLFRRRWEIETNFALLKTTLKMDV